MQTRLLLLCICIGSYLSGIAQPPVNDNCINAIVISALDGTCTVGVDNTNAVEDIGPGACTVGANENVWFSFVADGVSAEIVVSNLIGTPEITVIHFPTTACNIADGQEIDCITGSPLLLDNQLIDGQVYYVMVAFSNNPDGLFDICIDNPDPALNDDCIDATPLTNLTGVCNSYNNDFPSTDLLIPSCFTGSTYNVWYSFVAVGVSLDVNIPGGGPGAAQFAVIDFTGADCNITGAVNLGCETGTNHIVLDNQLVIGTTYYIVVGFPNTAFNGNGVGNFDLCVDNPIPAPNDFCDDAIVIPNNVLDDPNTCFTSIAGNPLNNDWPSTDVALFSCWNTDDSYNIWYSFVSQGNDVSIEVDPVFNEDAEIVLIEFTGADCDIVGLNVLSCANGTILDFNDDLVIGNTYFIAIGFSDNGVGDFCMNVFNPEPPPNDLPCDAIALPTNGNCVDGTTIYANPEPYGVPQDCEVSGSNTVWYTLSMTDPLNVGYEIELDLDDVNPTTEVSVILWEITDCNFAGPIAFFYCGDPPTDPLEFAPVDETLTYYLSISTDEPHETDFEICVDEIPPCFTNDICEEATVIDNVQSDMAFVCVDGCNLYADPELINNACGIGSFSTVWFQVNTDGAATLLNVQVTSEDFDAPTITVFHVVGSPNCDNLVQIPLTQSDLACIVGSNGEAEALATDVGSSEIYYIAISSLNNIGGEFEICVNTISVASACVVQRDIEVTSRSGNGPLTGPFLPGETIGICMNVDSYTASGNGCQWFQGLVPIFGNGWDPSSFDANGQPIGATVNGNAMGVAGNGVYGASTFDWFNDVGYHHTNVFFQVGDLDGNGTVEMCNILYDPDCPNLGGITGGCCGPCWAMAGDILPPGWFSYGINGSCGTPGPPIAVDWGDGNTCGCCMGPWSFCFELIVRDYPDCLEDNTTMDLSLGFFTFADGEVGSWTGGASVCALDQPAKITLPMCCTELEEDEEMLDPICSGDVIVYSIDKPGVDFWQWTVDAGLVTGASDGEGGPGSIIIATLVNPGVDPETVEYTFLGFAGGACPVFEHTMTVDVLPQIQVVLDPLLACATPTTPYTITPTVTGGSGAYEYAWSPGGEITPSIMIANPVNGTQYIVTVYDDVGCVNTASVTIDVYATFPVDINAPTFEQCLQDGPITIEGSATGGIGAYDFVWTLPPDGTPFNGEDVTTDVTGHYVLVVTDEEGCVGMDSVDLTLWEEPTVTVEAVNGVLAICESQSTQLSGQAAGGESPYEYEWDTPEGPESGKTIVAFTPGTYTVTVYDDNGCTNSADVFVDDQPEPVPDLGPDIYVCNFDQEVDLTVVEDYEDYAWSIGPAGDGLQTISVFDPGTYTVTVTNEYGCTGETEIEVDTFPQPQFNLPDTFEMCAGSILTIDADDYGDGFWAYYIWAQCPTCVNSIDITGAGVFDVCVYDDNDCEVCDEFTVVETTTLNPGVTGPDVICTGNSITLNALPGFTSYSWSPGGETTPSINVTAPGTYTVTVLDIIGCSGIESHDVASGDITTSILGPTAICAGVLAPLSAVGSPLSSYLWSPSAGGATTQSVMVDDGSHSVTVTSADGCIASANITIIETPFVPSITGDNMICQTSESTILDAGGPYTNYQWSANAGSATTQNVIVSAAGTYSVTITDLATCVGTASFDVGNHPVPFVAISGLPDFCVGGNTEMSATSGFPFYAWNTLEVNDTITINTAGNYVVTVTDANGCTNTAVTTVNPPYQETVDITGSVVFCPGNQTTLGVPPGYASVLWSTGETTNQIIVSTEGPISVDVVDADGCIASDMVTTVANAVLSPTITGDLAICDAGTSILDAGPGFETYQWCCGLPSSQTVPVTSPGTYTVTVSIATCTGTDDFTVVQHVTPSANVISTATACNVQEPGGPTTSINFNSLITSGDNSGPWVQSSGPSSVNLSNLTNVNFNGLPVGTYTFTYTTATAIAPCTNQPYTLTVTVNDCACPVVDVGLAPDLCNDLGSINLNTLVTGVPGGAWTIISAPPGSNPAQITGSNFDASTGDAGTYTLQYSVTGLPSYCSNSVTTTINVLRTPVAGTAATPLQFCAGESQNVALSTLLIGADAGGTWVESSVVPSTGGAFNPATGRFDVVAQVPGIYTFEYIIAGVGPCPDDVVTVTVEIENNPVADAGATATLDCNQTSTILGGSGSSTGIDFSYSWTTSDGTISNPNQLHPTASAAGTYVLTVMNNLTGCMAMDQVVISSIGDFPSFMDILVQSPDCAGDPPGNAQVSAVTGGVEPYTYSLNGAPPVSSPVFPNLPAGDYEIEVTDDTGCKLKDSFTIEELVVVDLAIINYVQDTLIFAFGDTIKLSYLYTGTGNTPDSIVWELEDSVICINCTVLEIVADLAGEITLTAYDVRGCIISRSINYLVVRNRDVFIPNVFSPNDDNVNDWFTLFTDADVKEISLLEVYTRWGDLVYRSAGPFDPNVPEQGWDGTFKGESLNPGVYVYRMEILYGDNLVEKLSGDITIIR